MYCEHAQNQNETNPGVQEFRSFLHENVNSNLFDMCNAIFRRVYIPAWYWAKHVKKHEPRLTSVPMRVHFFWLA